MILKYDLARMTPIVPAADVEASQTGTLSAGWIAGVTAIVYFFSAAPVYGRLLPAERQ